MNDIAKDCLQPQERNEAHGIQWVKNMASAAYEDVKQVAQNKKVEEVAAGIAVAAAAVIVGRGKIAPLLERVLPKSASTLDKLDSFANLDFIPGINKGGRAVYDATERAMMTKMANRSPAGAAAADDFTWSLHDASAGKIPMKGLDSLDQFDAATAMKRRFPNSFVDPSATVLAPAKFIGESTYISSGARIKADVKIGASSSIGRDVQIQGPVTIGSEAKIGNFTSVDEYSKIGNGSSVGENAKLKFSSKLSDHVHVGSGVQIESSTLNPGVKVGSGAYLHYADVREGAQIGANARVEGEIVREYRVLQDGEHYIAKGPFGRPF